MDDICSDAAYPAGTGTGAAKSGCKPAFGSSAGPSYPMASARGWDGAYQAFAFAMVQRVSHRLTFKQLSNAKADRLRTFLLGHLPPTIFQFTNQRTGVVWTITWDVSAGMAFREVHANWKDCDIVVISTPP